MNTRKPDPGLIERTWQVFRDHVIPRDAPDIQVRSCRMAFFGGATSLYSLVIFGLSDGDTIEQSDLNLMQRIDAELREFAVEMECQAGVAPNSESSTAN